MSTYTLPLSPWASGVALSASDAWCHLLRNILTCGQTSRPRGMAIKELLGSQVIVDMQRPVVTCVARKLSYKFMAAEAWWILSGRNDVASISKYCKAIAKFSDDGETFFGAYGPKIADQLPYVVEKLRQDNDTRQAVVNIWRESPPATNDVPCTISVQWFIREGGLHCIDTMRSNDAWLGFPYDVFNFSMLSWTILEALRRCDAKKYGQLELGSLCLNAGSHHLYEQNLVGARQIVTSPMEVVPFRALAGEHLGGCDPADHLATLLGEEHYCLPDNCSDFFETLRKLVP